jgi:uncharacterized protein YukE
MREERYQEQIRNLQEAFVKQQAELQDKMKDRNGIISDLTSKIEHLEKVFQDLGPRHISSTTK